MGKRIFGSIDSFVEVSDPSLKIGRLVANFSFLQALVTYGDFDQFQIYCPTLENLNLLHRRLEATVDGKALDRVVLSHHFNLKAALAETDFSAFHLGDWYWYMPKMAGLRARFARHPFPLTAPIHSLNGADMLNQVRVLTASTLRPGDSIFCTSTNGRGIFNRYLDLAMAGGGNRPGTDLVPLGVAEEYFARRERQACRQRLGLAPGGFHILYLGRLSVATKTDLVPIIYLLARLRAEAAQAAGQGVDWRLVLAGGGTASDLENLRQAIGELGLSEHVLLKPNVSDEDKLDLLGAADVFLSPVDNFQETFGISIIEAMASGLPVVASDFDGYRDLVQEGETGFRIPTLCGRPPEMVCDLFSILEPNLSSLAFGQGVALDLEVLRERLVALAGSPDLRRSLGEKGREVARREFSWQAVIRKCDERWRALKEQAMAAGRGPVPAPAEGQDFHDIFRDYPTAHLDASRSVAATPLMESILAGRVPMPATYADMSLLSSGDLISAILQALGGEACTIREVQDRVAASHGISADFTAYQIVWFLKYGLLRQL